MKAWRGSVVAVVVAAGLVTGPVAQAAPPDSSAVTVSTTSLAPGTTFTVAQEIHNPTDFTVTSAHASVGGLTGLAELVSCTGALVPCFDFGSTYRGFVGELAPGEVATVEFTFRVRDDVAGGVYQWTHQFAGGNYAFEELPGPALTVTAEAADLRVGLRATVHGLLAPRVDYAVTVTNDGDVTATGIRLAATYAPGLGWAGSSDCVPGGGRAVTCAVDTLAAGQSRTVRFSTGTGLLALGPFTTSVVRAASTPADPDPSDDRATSTCYALTGLLVSC
ncbi:hypothetical protein [Actinophytocola xinjiangensis]|uniref:hypothetical protein n=1 Tax=Actinophytocola xinjiangensis TaxID=485602 RepID=UPI000AE8762F|nr:hypothetical protein [Actinophytocola xinjiangensis]